MILVRDPLGKFDPQALLCTNPAQDPVQFLSWFVQRWQLEVTFREVRDHLGVETHRQWLDKAIARTTPCLLGLFSLLALLGPDLGDARRTSWFDVDVEAADWVASELLLARLVAFDILQPGDAMAFQAPMQG